MSEREYCGPLAAGFRFRNVAIRARDLIYLGTVAPGMQRKGLPCASFCGHDSIEFGLIGGVKWNCVSVCAPTVSKPQMVATGEYGQVKVVGSDDEDEERLTSEELELPAASTRWACSVWPTGVAPPGAAEVSSFDSIDGFDEHDLHAAGLDGAV